MSINFAIPLKTFLNRQALLYFILDYHILLPDGRSLGDTPANLYIALKQANVPITQFVADFPQPHYGNLFTLLGIGILVSAREAAYHGKRVVQGSVHSVNPDISELQIEKAIERFCLGSPTSVSMQ